MPTVYGHEDFASRDAGEFYVYNVPLSPVSLNDNAYVRSEGSGEIAQITDGKLVVPPPEVNPSIFLRFHYDAQNLPELDVIIVGNAGTVITLSQYGPDGISSSPLVVSDFEIASGGFFRCSLAIDAAGDGYLQSLTNPEIDEFFSYDDDDPPGLTRCQFNILEGTIEAVLFVSPDYVYGPAIEQPFWTNLVHCKQRE